MFNFGKKPKSGKDDEKSISPSDNVSEKDVKASEEKSAGFFGKLIDGLGKTRANLSEGLESLILGTKAIDASLLEDLVTKLLSADVGIEATGILRQSLCQIYGGAGIESAWHIHEQQIFWWQYCCMNGGDNG